MLFIGSSQEFPYQDEVGQENEAEPTNPSVGQNENWKHNQVC